MANELIKYRVCDKCPKDTVATETHKLHLNGYRYDIDLCERHAAALYVAVMKWASIGTLVGEPTVFDKPRTLSAPVSLSNLPPRVTPPQEPLRALESTTQAPGVPVADFADRWFITLHARQRMQERNINLADALRAAEYPNTVTPSAKIDGYYEHVRDGTLVVVHMDKIITVAHAASSGRSEANGT